MDLRERDIVREEQRRAAVARSDNKARALAAKRAEPELTQKQLAERFRVSPDTISKWMRKARKEGQLP